MKKKYTYLLTYNRKQLYKIIIEQIKEIKKLNKLIESYYYKIGQLRLIIRGFK